MHKKEELSLQEREDMLELTDEQLESIAGGTYYGENPMEGGR